MKSKFMILFCLVGCLSGLNAQMVLLNTYNTPSLDQLCGVGFDAVQDRVWVYDCFNDSIHCLSSSGIVQYAVVAPGENANDLDVETLPVSLSINGTAYAPGQLLFINGETNVTEIYVVDNLTGVVTDTLSAMFGNSHVVGGSFHQQRNSFFLVQDNVPAAALSNRIAEIDPVTSDTIQTFAIGTFFDVSYGDLEVGASGNIFVISSLIDSIAEFTPQGGFVQKHALPAGVNTLSGIALDCDNNEAWVVNVNGQIFHLGQFPCGTSGFTDQISASVLSVYPNPSSGIFGVQHEIRNFSIYNSMGKLVQHQSGPSKIIDLTTFPDGIYLLNLENKGSVRLLKN